MRLLVCGSRNWTCQSTIETWLLAMARYAKARNESVTMIHGACGKRNDLGVAYVGADVLAHDIGVKLGFTIEEYPAEWKAYKDAAGPIRNRQMLQEGRPDRGLAFGPLVKNHSGSLVKLTGTGDMVSLLNAAGILVTVVPRAGVMP
jgi:hypothetical protein